jgi:predicted ATPase
MAFWRKMLGLDSELEMVGREESLEELQSYLGMASDGFGGTVLISGEAGIGKTRLVDELKTEAATEGFQVLSGYSLHESLTPYMPFMDALRSGGLEHLFAEESPKVEGVYLVTKTGLLIKEVIREETELDPDLFASMLTTVGDFVGDTLTQLKGQDIRDSLNKLGYGDYTILIESGLHTYLVAIITGEDNEFLIDDMRSALHHIDEGYGGVLEAWDGNEAKLEGIERFLQLMIRSGKYDGIYYGKNDPQSRRNLLFENVSLGLTRQSKNVPTLLCLEDLQWADPSSLALMHYVARNTRKSNLLILGTYRPEDVSVKEGQHHPLIETMQLMSREELFDRLDLERLCDDCLPDFLRCLLGEVDFSDEFTGRVYEETEGNPLYIIELVKLLVDERVITNENGVWRLAEDLEQVLIPSKIQDVIVRRLNRVESDDRKVLDYASVVGVVFTSEILSAALGMKKLQLLERLRVLEKTHNLLHSQDGAYRFDHAKVREVLYNEVPQELRMEYHAVVASSIMTLYGDNLDKVVGDLAFHFKHCRDKEKAPIYLTRAAEEAKKSYANEEAIRFYCDALEFQDEKQKRREILENLGAVYELIGDYDKSLDAYRSALELAEEDKKRADIGTRIGAIYETKGEYDESLAAYADALELVKGKGSKDEAYVLSGIGTVFWSKGDIEEALKNYRIGLQMGERTKDEKLIATSLANIGNIHIYQGDYDGALENCEKSLELREMIGDQRSIAHSLGNIGALQYYKGEYGLALGKYEQGLKIFEKIGDAQGIAYIHNNIGVLHEDRSEYDQALLRYEKSLKILKKIGDQNPMAVALHNIGLVHRRLGEYDDALKKFRESLEIGKRIGYQMGAAFNYCGMAETYLDKKDPKKALEFSVKALELSEEIDAKEYIALSKKIFGMAYRELEDWNESMENFRASVMIFEEIGRDKELGESHFEFGMMWKLKGDAAQAREHLEKAVEIFKTLKLEGELGDAEGALVDLKQA